MEWNAEDLHCISEMSLVCVAITFTYMNRFIIFGRNITEKVSNKKMLYHPTAPVTRQADIRLTA